MFGGTFSCSGLAGLRLAQLRICSTKYLKYEKYSEINGQEIIGKVILSEKLG